MSRSAAAEQLPELEDEDLSGANLAHVACFVELPVRFDCLKGAIDAHRQVQFDLQAHAANIDEALEGADAVIIECRLVEAVDDFQTIQKIRQARALIPIICISKNDNKDFHLAAYAAGATFFIASESSAEELVSQLARISAIARAARMVEVQNDELLRNMTSLRIANEQLRKEIVERERAEAERTRAQSQLANASKMASLGEMAGGIAHEINNPLAIIVGRLELIEQLAIANAMPMDKLIKDTQALQKTCLRISMIIKGLKSFSRTAESDPFELVALRQIVEETLPFCIDNLRRHDIDFAQSDIDEKYMISCRSTQLSQVLLNLINNARDALVEQKEKWIRLEVVKIGDQLEIIVKDSGRGISPEIQAKMFEPFFSTKLKGQGTGLGLSISKGIIEDHSGSLTYREIDGRTAFVVTLPLGR